MSAPETAAVTTVGRVGVVQGLDPALLACAGLLAWLGACRPGAREDEPLQVEVVGRRFAWHVRHPGADGKLDTADDRVAKGAPVLPAGRDVVLHLTSADYLYSFRVRALGVNDVALPGLVYEQRFQTGAPAELELQADQFCGFRHDELRGTLRVASEHDYAAYLEALPLYADGLPDEQALTLH